MKKNILVFPCGSEIGLDIHRQMKFSTHFHLIGGNSVDDHGQYVYDDYIGNIPFLSEKSFIPAMQRIIKERKIDAVYPATDATIALLKQHEADLGCKIIGPPVEITEVCLSKEETYKRLSGLVTLPQVYKQDDILPYPVFVKPKIGYGSRGAKLINNAEELAAVDDLPSKLILEYLPGDEYTVDCFTDRHGKLLYTAARIRNRVRAGISVNTSFVTEQGDFRLIAEKINKAIGFRGAWFFQVKRNKEGELSLLEIAARFGGSSLLSAAIGVNFPLLTLFDAFGYDVHIHQNSYNIEIDRAFSCKYKHNIKYSCVYVDFDDCLYLNRDSINTELIGFLFHCINKGIKIILLTKHEGNLDEKLHRFRISHLFDEVFHIPSYEKKYKFMTEQAAIFIDDSYAERKQVADNLHIPVFSPEMVEILI